MLRLIPGQQLAHFRLIEKIGEGGMGIVWKALDTTLDRQVAIKVLPPEIFARPERLARFKREARALAALNHPGIVTIFSIEESEGIHFFAMELVDGRPLSEMIPEGGMPLDQLLAVAILTGRALVVAHERGVIHRDLKPANIMVLRDGSVKILDFGLAKIHHPEGGEDAADGSTMPPTLTRAGQILGTSPYLSPEQIEEKPTDQRSDIFSFGVILFELAAGWRPFHGDSRAAQFSAILREPPPPLAEVRPEIDPALETIVCRCLEKDPDRRYQTADELCGDLEALNRGEKLAASATTTFATRPHAVTGPATATAPAKRRRFRWWVPLAVLAVASAAMLVAWWLGPRSAPVQTERTASLAILPLTSLSSDVDQEFFADGMTESLITELARIDSLRVISRASAMRYKGAGKSPSEVARELGVDAIVEGSVLGADGRVRVSARLIRGASGELIWADSYERDMRDVLTLQRELARAIVSEVRVTLNPDDRERLSSARPVDPAAYVAYLRGVFQWNRRTLDGFAAGKEFFERAIEIDPDYVPPYAGLANSYHSLAFYGALQPSEAYPNAKAAAATGVEIDGSFAEPHTALAEARFVYDWDWAGAEAEFRKAIALNPGYATAHHWYAEYLAAMGRFDEAGRVNDRAGELDPLSLVIDSSGGWIQYFARRFDLAEERSRATLETDPSFPVARWVLGMVLSQTGRLDEAVAELERAVESSGRSTVMLGALGHAHAVAGNRKGAEGCLDELRELAEERYISPLAAARIRVGLGDDDEALRLLQVALADRTTQLCFLNVDPVFDRLRGDPRFDGLLLRIGFPED